MVLSRVATRGRAILGVIRHARSEPEIGPDPPLVSVVLATYNWSSVLRHAVRSVLPLTVARGGFYFSRLRTML